MKKLLWLILPAAMLAAACTDLDPIETRLDQLEARVSVLEQLKTDVASLQTIVTKLQSNVYVQSKTAIDGGYRLTFTDGTSIEIKNGEDGAKPVITAEKDTDGKYYWKVDESWLLDAGKKIPVTGEKGADGTNGTNGTNGTDGQDGVTPQLDIRENPDDGNALWWYVSYDKGTTWKPVHAATTVAENTCLFSKVLSDAEYIYLYQTGVETPFVIPLAGAAVKLQLIFDESVFAEIRDGETLKTNYTITAPTGVTTTIQTFEFKGWGVNVTRTSDTEGEIAITAPDPAEDGKIMFVLTGDNGTTFVKVITIAPSIGSVDASYSLDAEGGEIILPIKAQSVVIPEAAQAWLSAVVETKQVKLNLLSNGSYGERSSEITVKTVKGDMKTTITQLQNDAIVLVAPDPVGYEGGTFDLPVNANVEFTAAVTSGDSWISDVKVKALTETVYTVTVAPSTTVARTGEITFTSKDGKTVQKVAVKQNSRFYIDTSIATPANPRNTCPVFNKECTRAYFVTRGARQLHEIDLESGKMGWMFDMNTGKNENGGCICVNPFTGDIIVSNQGGIICVKSDGTKKWEKAISGGTAPSSMPGCGPAINNDGTVVFAPAVDKNFYALSAADGSVLATYDMTYTGGSIQYAVFGSDQIFMVRNGLNPVFLTFTGSDFTEDGTIDNFKVGLSDITSLAIDKAQSYVYIQRSGGWASFASLKTKALAGNNQHNLGNSWSPCITPDGHVAFAVQSPGNIRVIDAPSSFNTATKWVTITTGVPANGLNFQGVASDTDNNLYFYNNTTFSFYNVPVTGGTPAVLATLDKTIPEYQATFNYGGKYIVVGGGSTAQNRIVVLKVDKARANGWSGNGGDPCATKNANIAWAE